MRDTSATWGAQLTRALPMRTPQATLSNARPEIGDYAFTTLRPQLGRVHNGGKHFMAGVHDSATVADIPGLIQGAHENRGLVRMQLSPSWLLA